MMPDIAPPAAASPLPGHVAVIMDGNGRWARARGLERSAGHREGLEATRRAVRFFAEQEIPYLTLFAFSSENWERPREEVEALFDLFLSAIEMDLPELTERGVSLRFIGNRDDLPRSLQVRMNDAEQVTAANAGMHLIVALGYGGRWDILQAARRWIRQWEQGEGDEASFAACLSTAGIPDVDLLIRTGGEQRISNFLLWQSAYAELLFLETFWPDVGTRDLDRSLQWYARRQRRFGRVSGVTGSASSEVSDA